MVRMRMNWSSAWRRHWQPFTSGREKEKKDGGDAEKAQSDEEEPSDE